MSCREGIDFSGMKTIPGVVWRFFFFAHFIKKEKWAYDICCPVSTLEPADRFLQNLAWTLYTIRGNGFQFRAVGKSHMAGARTFELEGRGLHCQHFVWGLEVVYDEGA